MGKVVGVLLLGAALLTQEQALALLANGSETERRQAAAELGDTGTMAAVPALVEALRDADDLVRNLAEQSLWRIWSRSGEDRVDALLQEGILYMAREEFPEAVARFDQVIALAPRFAEGYNKRATVYYLMGEYQKSIADCERTVRLNPYHFGALSGEGLNYLALGKLADSLVHFERALDVNPNLQGVRRRAQQIRQELRQRTRDTI